VGKNEWEVKRKILGCACGSCVYEVRKERRKQNFFPSEERMWRRKTSDLLLLLPLWFPPSFTFLLGGSSKGVCLSVSLSVSFPACPLVGRRKKTGRTKRERERERESLPDETKVSRHQP